jgi:alanyl-tRNA synthetase
MDHLGFRQKFFDFFKEKGHVIVLSSSLLPKDDPSVLLTSAGMQQFKPYFVGLKDPVADLGAKNVVSIQKCFRTADIDEVSDDTHLTFFEMVGHFSFGGYFKDQALAYAWEFLTDPKWLGLDKSRIYATYYNGDKSGTIADDESRAILENLPGLAKIVAQGAKDNFWGPTGAEGPCGPNVEFYVDGVEVWNEVFNQYYSHPDGLLTLLETPGVDMGGGLERLLVAINSSGNLFATDVLSPITDLLGHLPEKSRRIIADHARGSVFLLADHVMPSNKEQGYILRRILRRLLLHIQGSNVSLEVILGKVIEIFASVYPELPQQKTEILSTARAEADKFVRTIDLGNKELAKLIEKYPDRLPGEEAFKLFASYGLPIDFIKEKINVDEDGFDEAFIKHQEISRAGVEQKFGGHGLSAGAVISDADKQKITRLHTATHLLHAALMKVLGGEASQAGSDINPERTRFDFNFPRKVTPEELQSIEDWVNKKIAGGFVVKKDTLPYAEAVKSGAVAFFKEKYPDMVDVYTLYNEAADEIVSRELCGGPHIVNSFGLGHFKILKEESSSAGVRRIKATLES